MESQQHKEMSCMQSKTEDVGYVKGILTLVASELIITALSWIIVTTQGWLEEYYAIIVIALLVGLMMTLPLYGMLYIIWKRQRNHAEWYIGLFNHLKSWGLIVEVDHGTGTSFVNKKPMREHFSGEFMYER